MTPVRTALICSVVAALLVLPSVGHRLITTSDEARFALLAREMTSRHASFGARVSGEVYRNKPPLYPWSIAAVSLVRGHVTEATARIPGAAAAVGTVFLTALLGHRLFGPRAGLWAGLVLSTSFGFVEHSQLILPDMLVTLFFTGALYTLWLGMTARDGRTALIAFYACCALGVLSKGPVGLVPLLVAAVWLGREQGREGLRRLWSPIGLLVFAVLTVTWLAPFVALGAGSFVGAVVWEEWLLWYVGLSMPWSIEQLAVGFLPWTLLLPLAGSRAFRAPRSRATTFVLVSIAVPLAAMLLSRHQLDRYVLPIYPSLALLVGRWADSDAAVPTIGGTILGWGALLSGVALVAAPAWADLPLDGFPLHLSGPVVLMVSGVGLAAAAFFLGLHRGGLHRGGLHRGGLHRARPALMVYGVTAGMGMLLGAGLWLYDDWLNRSSDYRRLAEALRQHAGAGEAAAFTTSRHLQIDFYFGRDLVPVWKEEMFDKKPGKFSDFMARAARPVAVIDGSTWMEIRERISVPVVTLDQLPSVGGEDMLILRGAP
jgi:4-amino-4-deoxy-L-arabinose transferase-like glycosyltransferase